MALDFPWQRLTELAARPEPDRLLQEGLAFLLKVAQAQAGAIAISGSVPRRLSQGSIPKSLRQALEEGKFTSDKSKEENARSLNIPVKLGRRSLGWVALIRNRGSPFKIGERELIVSQARALGELAWLAGEMEYLQRKTGELSRRLSEDQSHILRAQEEVRRELARDLHDGTVQRLATIAMGLEYVQQLLQARPEAIAHELESLRTLAMKTSQEARLLLFELRPLVLESQGLAAALHAYMQQIPVEGVKINLDLGNFNRRLALEREEAIFDVIQEAVSNARQHAKAENIFIRLMEERKWLVCAVEDDGWGFDPMQVEKTYDRRLHFGLVNIRERAEIIGGYVTIDSLPGRGTKVTLRVPVS